MTGPSVIVLGIDTSTAQTSVALGTEREIVGAMPGSPGPAGTTTSSRRSSACSSGPASSSRTSAGSRSGSVRGCTRVCGSGVEAAKTLAQVLGVPIVGICSLDVLAFAVQHTRRLIVAVIDARRGEVFSRSTGRVPGGVMREGEYGVATPAALAAELEIEREEMLLVGNGAILYRQELEQAVPAWSWLRPALAHPWAAALVESGGPEVHPRGDRPARGRGTAVPEEDGCGDRLGSASPRRLGLR